ncbi:MAG: hypothetical protein EOO88_33905 [Pedobacter sp.]|nr:MAG: hypothetical protein EOO88_33905 [Pedobacter sp.]
MKTKKLLIIAAANLLLFATSCVNDPEKHTESEADPGGKDTIHYDSTSRDSVAKNDSIARKSAHEQPK